MLSRLLREPITFVLFHQRYRTSEVFTADSKDNYNLEKFVFVVPNSKHGTIRKQR